MIRFVESAIFFLKWLQRRNLIGALAVAVERWSRRTLTNPQALLHRRGTDGGGDDLIRIARREIWQCAKS